MKMRLIAALALAVGAVSLTAQEPNPYAKSKVGDFAVYKTTTKVAGVIGSILKARMSSR